MCRVVLQLILKGKYKNETEKRNKCRKAGRSIGCCVRKEGNKTIGKKRPVYIKVSSLRNSVRMAHELTLSSSMSQS